MLGHFQRGGLTGGADRDDGIGALLQVEIHQFAQGLPIQTTLRIHGRDQCPVSYTHLDVYKRQGEHNSLGRIFVDPGTAEIVDLSKAKILACSVDTVRQLYRGLIRPEIMSLFEKPGTIVDFAGQRWHSGRVSKDSGYQYKLQNADLGIILLVKNFNAKIENIGPHLKIEVSPHAIDPVSYTHLDVYKRQAQRCYLLNYLLFL